MLKIDVLIREKIKYKNLLAAQEERSSRVREQVGPPKSDAVFSKCFNGSILAGLKEIFNTLEDMSDSIVANNRFVYKNCYLLRRLGIV